MTGENLAYGLPKLKYTPDPSVKQSTHEPVLASPPPDQTSPSFPEQTPATAKYPRRKPVRFSQNNSARTGDNQEKNLLT